MGRTTEAELAHWAMGNCRDWVSIAYVPMMLLVRAPGGASTCAMNRVVARPGGSVRATSRDAMAVLQQQWGW